MNKIRNHSIGATATAVAMAAVLMVGCTGGADEDCREDESMSASLIVGKGGGGKGGGGGKSSSSRGGSTSKGKSSGKSSGKGSGKAKAPKVHTDDEDCD